MRWSCATFVLLLLAGASDAQEPERTPFQEAELLRKKGQDKQAFLEFLKVRGGEYAAVRVALPHPDVFLGLLARAEGVPVACRKLVEGDLRAARGQRQEALKCYRALAAAIGPKDAEKYFVEPPDAEPEAPVSRDDLPKGVPFVFGPGSQRDNWLLRRFLALKAWDEAAAEFARVADIHRRNTLPFVALIGRFSGFSLSAEGECPRVFRPGGFDSSGLLFAIDHAYFWKRHDRMDRALALLIEPLLLIDLDKDSNRFDAGEPLEPGKPLPFPIRPSPPERRSANWGSGYGGGNSGFTSKEFIRLALGAFKEAGKEADLVAALQKEIAAGKNSLRRVLAQVRLHQGKVEEAKPLKPLMCWSDAWRPLTTRNTSANLCMPDSIACFGCTTSMAGATRWRGSVYAF
jgi:hypothetical protein